MYIQRLRNGPTTRYLNEMFEEVDNIPADKLEFEIFGNEATLDDVQATLVSLNVQVSLFTEYTGI